MSTGKLIVLMIGWVLAAIAIAIVISIVFTEVTVLVGFVDWGTPQYAWTLNGIALVMFLGLVSIPIVFRKRFAEPDLQSEDQ